MKLDIESLILEYLKSDDIYQKIEKINFIKKILHENSPFNHEPVDCVLWVKSENVVANDYNPNSVAPPEMKLLKHSIESDGYTQPIVTWETNNLNEVVDGFHRHRIGKEYEEIKNKIHGYLPIVCLKENRHDRNDRVAATIRHNRARGKHKIDAMSEIVIDLKRRNWSPKKIAKELGMDQDEVLRLTQITGLTEMFNDKEFSEAWEAEDYGEIKEDLSSL